MSVSSSNSRNARLRDAIKVMKASAAAQKEEIPARPAGATPLLDDLQRGMWLAQMLDPESATYHLVSAARVHGKFDPALVEAAFNAVVQHHRLLRSTFYGEGDTVVQHIHEQVDVVLEQIVADPDGVEATGTRAARSPLDLERGPLCRLLLVEEPARGERLLVMVLHHLLTDERSMAQLWRSLAKVLEGGTAGDASAPQYDDWAHWRRTGDTMPWVRDLEFWRERLDPLPEPLELPFEPPGDQPALPGRLLTRTVDRQLALGLAEKSRRAGTTPFAIGAFVTRLLLQRLAGNRAFALGTPVSVRHHPDELLMLGAFINPVLIPDGIDEDAPVDEALGRFDRALREAMAHASAPFTVLAETLGEDRQMDRHPLFQAMFVYRQQETLPNLGKARLEPVTLDLGVAKFDLTLFLTERGADFDLAVEYRADRFDPDAVSGLLEQAESLLRGLVDQSDRPVADLPWFDADTHDRITDALKGPALKLGVTDFLPRQIERRAVETPHADAVVSGDMRFDHAALSRRATGLCAALAAVGVRSGDRVGIQLPRSFDLIAGIVAILRAGAAYVPLDPDYPPGRNAIVLEDAKVRAFLSTRNLESVPEDGAWAVINVEDVPETEDDVLSPVTNVLPEDVAYLLYTSGSTGRPKGVEVTHANLRASTAARLQFYGDAPPRFLLLPSVAFDSSVAGIFGALAAGGTIVLPNGEVLDPRSLGSLIARARVTHLLCVPSLYSLLLEEAASALAGLETVIVAGEPCPPSLVRRHYRDLPETRLFNEYGPTEATVWATVHEVTESEGRGSVSIGRPIPGVRVELLDQRGRLVPPGVPGRLWIAGPTVARGYWQQPGLSAERFVASPDGTRRYDTGDLASLDASGRLRFHGREDGQLKLRGFRIEPGEIEAALAELPGIRYAVVVARSDRQHESPAPDHLMAFVEGDDERPPAGWRNALAKRLPAHMIPVRMVVLPALPRLPNGKFDRNSLVRLPVTPGEAPKGSETFTPRQANLAALWEKLLGQPGFGPDDNFFTIGGHSLLAVRLAMAVERDLGVKLQPSEVFAHPTIRQLDERIASLDGDGSVGDGPRFDHLFPIRKGGAGTPFIVAIPHFFADLFAERFQGERPVFGLRGIGHRPEGNLGQWPTMELLGEAAADEICCYFPDQPVILAGYSFGASMALEVARNLESRGVEVRHLVLIAPMAFDMAQVGPFRLQLVGLREPTASLSSREALSRWLWDNRPWRLNGYRRLWRRTMVEGGRRSLCAIARLRRGLGRPLTERMQWADARVDRFRLQARYTPGPIHVPTRFFHATADDGATDVAATWRDAFSGPVEWIETPDPHRGDAAVSASRSVLAANLDDLEGESHET